MQFVIGLDQDKYRPNVPIVTGANYTLGHAGANNLDVTVTMTGGQATLVNILTGYLYVRGTGAGRYLEVEVANLNRRGKPNAVIDHVRAQNPQLMPFPARIRYHFPITDATLRTHLTSYIDGVLQYHGKWAALTKLNFARTKRNRTYEIQDRATLLDAILNDGVGIYFDGGATLHDLPSGQVLTLSADDLKNYSAIDEPLAVLDGLTPGTDTIQHIYRIDDCDDSFDPDPADVTDYVSSLRTPSLSLQAGGANEQKFVIVHDDFKGELGAVVHYRRGGTDQKGRFTFDKYEHTALHPTNLRWHLRNWYISGFLREADRTNQFVTGLVTGAAANRLYPANHGANVAVSTRTITPPSVTIHSYADGETKGHEKPIYRLLVPNMVKIRVHRASADQFSVTRAALFSPNTPGTAPDATAHFTHFHYDGADEIEEYIKRVAAVEYDVGTQRETEGLKAQMVAARTFFLYWLLTGTSKGGVTVNNLIRAAYGEQRVYGGDDFHVHRIDKYNHWCRKEPERLLLEESVAESWGIILTYRGRMIDAEFFGRGATIANQTNAGEAYKRSVWTQGGGGAHGRGLAQVGAEHLAGRGLSFLQILHWYYYGIQARNDYGKGDVLTDAPAAPGTATHSWLANHPAPTIPNPDAVTANNATPRHWVTPHVLDATHANDDWHVSHDRRAAQFSIANRIQNPNPTLQLDVHWNLVTYVQEVIYKYTGNISEFAIVRYFGPNSVQIGVPTAGTHAASVQTALDTIRARDSALTVTGPTDFGGLGQTYRGWTLTIS